MQPRLQGTHEIAERVQTEAEVEVTKAVVETAALEPLLAKEVALQENAHCSAAGTQALDDAAKVTATMVRHATVTCMPNR